MSKSGWCSAPEGARPMHAGCRVLDCTCECHQSANPQQNKGFRGVDVPHINAQIGDNWSGPSGVAPTTRPGPDRPTLDEKEAG